MSFCLKAIQKYNIIDLQLIENNKWIRLDFDANNNTEIFYKSYW